MKQYLSRRTLGLAVGSCVVLGLIAVVPSAAWAASQTQTVHFKSISDSWGTPSVPPPPTNTSTCPGPLLYDYTLANFTGNGVMHGTVNGAGDSWFTSTFTGTGTVAFYPASVLTFDSNGNVTGFIGNPQPDLVATGHLTNWFGFEANKQNQVAHGTINFQGTDGSGNPITFHNNAQFVWTPGMDPNGQPSFYVNHVTC